MKFRKTEKAYWTVVYYEGKRIAEFVKDEFETDDEFIVIALEDMGYEAIGKLPEKVEAPIVENPEVDVVLELIDDPKAAYEIVTAALKKGKAVVTANKKMVADHMTELYELQKEYNVPLLYEGSCCASIPIIRNLEEYYDNDLLSAVEGIFNGSTNLI